jgi:hypothetical protein
VEALKPGDVGRCPTAWSILREWERLSNDGSKDRYGSTVWQFWQFLRAHPIPGAALFVGPFLFILGLILDAHHLLESGFPPQYLEALGAIVFVLAIIGILFKWWNEHQKVVVATVAPPALALDHPNELSPEVKSIAKTYRTITLEDLRALYGNRTTAEADQLVSPYIGKWISVYGAVKNVTTYEHSSGLAVWFGEYPVNYVLQFNDEWKERVQALHIGDVVIIGGTIARIRRNEVTLGNCELLVRLQPSETR